MFFRFDAFVEEIDRAHAERLGEMVDGQQRHILATALDLTDKGTIRIHAHGDRFLAQIGRKTVTANISPNEFADIHPQLRNRSRILALRIIIRDSIR
jgi:hypothetical protein